MTFDTSMYTPAIALQPVQVPTLQPTMTPFGPASVLTQQTGYMPTVAALPDYAAQAAMQAAAQAQQQAQQQQIAQAAYAEESGKIAAQQEAQQRTQAEKQQAMQAAEAANAGRQKARQDAAQAQAPKQAQASRNTSSGSGKDKMAQVMAMVQKIAPQLKNIIPQLGKMLG